VLCCSSGKRAKSFGVSRFRGAMSAGLHTGTMLSGIRNVVTAPGQLPSPA
jgi:hypothetical protein